MRSAQARAKLGRAWRSRRHDPRRTRPVEADEGCKLTAYPDPITHADPWTIGYGATGPDIKEGTVWTQQQADDDLVERVDELAQQLAAHLPWLAALNPVRQDVLINIAYNIGLAGLLRWPVTLGAVGHGDYVTAAADIRNNKVWASQVHDRCTRCAKAMETASWD